MVQANDAREAVPKFTTGRLSVVGMLTASILSWLLVVASSIKVIASVPDTDRLGLLGLATVCLSPQIAIWTTRHFLTSRRVWARLPPAVLEQRCHGSLATVVDSEHRPLRSIGTTARSVAESTGRLLRDLTATPSVRIFRGLISGDATAPVTLAVSVGHTLVLLEPVAWPAGRYRTDGDGRIHCDGTFIGQSVAGLVQAVRHWRRRLPRSHRVSSLVIVQPGDGEYLLPAPTADVAFALAESAVPEIWRRVSGGRQAVSAAMLAALVAATS
jgi:hypothetical protein